VADREKHEPSFAEVAEAFTPPGADFEAFKAALHSQGAPAAVSPEFLAMLNTGGLFPQVIGQSGTTCARCDHPHGGPPGPLCLDAERQYGRSPLRRRPDLQLDAISPRHRPPGTTEQALRDADSMPLTDDLIARMRDLASGSAASLCPDPAEPGHGTGCMCGSWYLQRADAAREAAPAGGKEGDSPGVIAARGMREAFGDLTAGGFTEDQALKFLAIAWATRNGDTRE
jgi:hypothetical protein